MRTNNIMGYSCLLHEFVLSEMGNSTFLKLNGGRLGKLACPRVNDDQKIHVDDQKLNSGRPHDYCILESLFYKILLIFHMFLLLCKRNSPEDDHECLWTTNL